MPTLPCVVFFFPLSLPTQPITAPLPLRRFFLLFLLSAGVGIVSNVEQSAFAHGSSKGVARVSSAFGSRHQHVCGVQSHSGRQRVGRGARTGGRWEEKECGGGIAWMLGNDGAMLGQSEWADAVGGVCFSPAHNLRGGGEQVLRPMYSFFGSMAPRALPSNAVDASRAFLLSFEAQYGMVHPTFFEGSFQDAVRRGKRDTKFVLVYIHSPVHGDTDMFCRQTLSSDAVAEFVSTNFVVWAGDVTSRTGYEVANALRVTSYPYIGVMYAIGEELRIYDQMIGPLSVDDLLARLMTVLEEHDAILVGERLELEERAANRTLLQQQDDEYAQSLARDAAKAKQKQQEQQQQQAPQQQQPRPPVPKKVEETKSGSQPKKDSAPVAVANDNNVASQSSLSSSSSSVTTTTTTTQAPQKSNRVVELPPEPPLGSADSVHVVVRLPHGRIERRFWATDSIASVFQYVDNSLSGTDNSDKPYSLVTALPRVVYSRNGTKNLKEAGFQAKMALIYEEED